jgi:hypothetical protein
MLCWVVLVFLSGCALAFREGAPKEAVHDRIFTIWSVQNPSPAVLDLAARYTNAVSTGNSADFVALFHPAYRSQATNNYQVLTNTHIDKVYGLPKDVQDELRKLAEERFPEFMGARFYWYKLCTPGYERLNWGFHAVEVNQRSYFIAPEVVSSVVSPDLAFELVPP